MKNIRNFDLHMHTNYSLDGVHPVHDVLDACSEAKITTVSITDHDSCDCFEDIDINKTKFRGKIIYGMEADALVGNITYDILCYDFEIEKVREWAHNQYGTVDFRQTKIFDKLALLCEQLNLKIDDSIPYDGKVEYAHAALFRMAYNVPETKTYLEKLNVFTVTDLYRQSTTNVEFPLYIDMHIVWPNIKDVAKIIRENGGKIFLAHPFKYGENKDVGKTLDSCLPYVDGIEICNESTFEQVQYLYQYAKENNLLVSAGNDYHGSSKHSEVGVSNITDEMAEDINMWLDKCANYIEL